MHDTEAEARTTRRILGAVKVKDRLYVAGDEQALADALRPIDLDRLKDAHVIEGEWTASERDDDDDDDDVIDDDDTVEADDVPGKEPGSEPGDEPGTEPVFPDDPPTTDARTRTPQPAPTPPKPPTPTPPSAPAPTPPAPTPVPPVPKPTLRARKRTT